MWTPPLSTIKSLKKEIFENGSWSLDTAGMPRCGYIVRLGAWDNILSIVVLSVVTGLRLWGYVFATWMTLSVFVTLDERAK